METHKKKSISLSPLAPITYHLSLESMMTSSSAHQNHTTLKQRRLKPTAKTPSSATSSPSAVLKCPRCDSLNTKFCYYNNYSLSQPRHFCKNCRRYWTRGGALRNVPVGGSTRIKNKSACSLPHVITPTNVTSSSSHELALEGFRVNPPPPPPPPPPPAPTSASPTAFSGGLFSSYMFPMDRSYNLASSSTSIESLSSLSQDLHKFQQQRLMMTTSMFLQDSARPKPVLFQNVETQTGYVFDRSPMARGGGGRGATSGGSNANHGDAEGTLGIWFHNNNNTLL